MSRFESGVYSIRRPDVIALLDLYRVPDERRRAELRKISEEVWQTGWWDGYADDDIPGALMDLTWLESRARAIHSFHTHVLPGLLQTEDCARATIQAENIDAPGERIERWVEFRITRRHKLESDDSPALSVPLDQGMLYRPIGGARVMRDQLQCLREATRAPTIEVRVLPFDVGEHTSLSGSFRVIEMPDP